MHVDHVVYAAGPSGLAAEAHRLEEALGVKSRDGGVHPTFGTRMRLISLADDRYLEIVEVLDHPAAEKAAYGQAVRARSALGGGWLGWVVSVPDLAVYEQRLDRAAVAGLRYFPDGRALQWRQLGVRGLIADPQLPYFISRVSDEELRPSALQGTVRLTRVEGWLGTSIGDALDDVEIEFSSPSGYPGLHAVTFVTEQAEVRL